MVIDMQEERLDSIERLEQFLEGTAGVSPRVPGGEADRQAHVRQVLARFNYEQLRSGEVELLGKKVPVTSLSSYHKALEICNLLKAEIEAGRFLLSEPSQRLPLAQGMQSLNITGPAR